MMTIDKFGRHIHKHILKRHLQDDNVIEEFLKHPKLEEIVVSHARNVISPTAAVPSKYVLKLESSGSIAPTFNNYIISGEESYTNKLYEGKIVKVSYSDDHLVGLQVESERFNPLKPITLTEGALLKLKYIGTGLPKPNKTKPIFAEVVIEGNVIS